MQQDALKTSVKQRILVGIIAVILLISTISIYIAVILSGGTTSSSATSSSSDLDTILNEYYAKYSEIQTASTELSDKYFAEFATYKSQVHSYNATTANENGVVTSDLKVGDGKTLEEGDNDYFAYYIGYCPNETVFDSSFDDYDASSSLAAPLDVSSQTLITGWYTGVIGMRLGGIREVTIPSDLAYGDEQEICDTTGSPLRFIIMAVERTDELAELFSELSEIQARYEAAYYEAYYQ